MLKRRLTDRSMRPPKRFSLHEEDTTGNGHSLPGRHPNRRSYSSVRQRKDHRRCRTDIRVATEQRGRRPGPASLPTRSLPRCWYVCTRPTACALGLIMNFVTLSHSLSPFDILRAQHRPAIEIRPRICAWPRRMSTSRDRVYFHGECLFLPSRLLSLSLSLSAASHRGKLSPSWQRQRGRP